MIHDDYYEQFVYFVGTYLKSRVIYILFVVYMTAVAVARWSHDIAGMNTTLCPEYTNSLILGRL